MPNPVEYAEKDLGVHKVWEETQTRLERHAELTERLADLHQQITTYKEGLADRESIIISDQGAHIAGMTKTAAKEHMNQAILDDPEHLRIRNALSEAESFRWQYDIELKHHSMGLTVLAARMQELGGLLHFYAVTKSNTTRP